MERGEVHALSMPWPVLKNEGAEWLKDKKINLILQTGADKNPELQQVPRMMDLARNNQEQQLLALFSSPSTIGRSVVAPPGLPKERTAELRRAFMDAIKDPALLKDVARMKLDLDPLPGEALQASIGGEEIPPALVKRAQEAAGRKN
jgi:hypothetical protein